MYRKDKKNEFYTKLAKERGYPARSIYKLEEIDKKYKIFNKGDKVLDLGCYPGSWLMYISRVVGEEGMVVGVDIEEIKIPLRKNVSLIKSDILNLEIKEIKSNYNSIVSDLAPRTSGIKSVDVAKSLELSQKALEVAKKGLLSGGNFVCKIFEGESVDDFIKNLSKHFQFCKKIKPQAVIKKSKEFYVVAKGFK